MNQIAILLLLNFTVATVLFSPVDVGDKSNTAQEELRFQQNQTSNIVSKNPIIIYGTIVVGWSALVVQFLVIPFFNKGEKLHQDYWGSGKINAAIAVIEADSLIPALATMFKKVTGCQEDRRRRPENEIEDLLQAAEFLPDLQSAHEAVNSMREIEVKYEDLKKLASKVWKSGLASVVFNLIFLVVLGAFQLMDWPFHWLIFLILVGWFFSLCFSIKCLLQFHEVMGKFTERLQLNNMEEL